MAGQVARAGWQGAVKPAMEVAPAEIQGVAGRVVERKAAALIYPLCNSLEPQLSCTNSWYALVQRFAQ